jgi:DNA-binding HxlR family transcriptional regulator
MRSDGTTRAVWLFLLRQGGRWSCAELAYALAGQSHHSIEQALTRMSADGFIKRFDKKVKGDRVTFGVTRECKVPRGIPLTALLEVGVLKEAA